MADKTNDKIFDYVSTSTDNTAVNIFNDKPEISKEDIHKTLDDWGTIPGIGEPADLLNSFLYGIEGNYGKAALSLASVLPIVSGTKSFKKIAEFARETRLRQAQDLANEMVDKGRMWNKHFDRPGDLSKPLRGKYKEIPKLRAEADLITKELEKDYYMRTIGRVPKHLKDK
mgnify:CR=1 FL=1|tara:strand:+ start:111 stop:623 length:513 start_codon:yes stop_codon:yes gene_type:complete